MEARILAQFRPCDNAQVAAGAGAGI